MSSSKKPTTSSSQVAGNDNIKPIIEGDDIDYLASEEDDVELHQICDTSIANQRSKGKFEDISISFVAGLIERKIESSRLGCQNCGPILDTIFHVNDKIDSDLVNSPASKRPCKSTFKICECAHEMFTRHCIRDGFVVKYESILKDIYNKLAGEVLYENSDFSHDLDHKRHLINFVTEEYIRMNATYVAKCLTLDEQAKMYRNHLKKIIHFYGQ